MQRLIALCKETSALVDGAMQVVDIGNGHVFGYVRQEQLLPGPYQLVRLAAE